MEQQLGLLIRLQEIDLRIRAFEEKKKRFPEALASLERRRAENKSNLEKTKKALETAQKNKRDRDKDLEVGVQKVETLKSRTSEIKTNKEYQALLKEIEAAETENKAIEDDILVLMEKIEAVYALIKTSEAGAREEEAAIDSEQKEQEASFASVENELKAAEQQRREAAASVQSSLLSRYDKLINAKGGSAIAEARG